MSDDNTPTVPWWKQPKNITWTGIIAVFAIAGVLITMGLRGGLTETTVSDGYLDVSEIEDVTEVETGERFDIHPGLLAAGFTVPTHGAFCDSDGNVVSEWERITINYSYDLSIGEVEGTEDEYGVFTMVDVFDNTNAPHWITQSKSYYISRTINPVIDVSTLAEGDVIDLTAYTDPETRAVFVNGCDLLPGQDFGRAYTQDTPPLLHRFNDDGQVNIATVYAAQSWYPDFEDRTLQYSAVESTFDNEMYTQVVPLYPLQDSSWDTYTYTYYGDADNRIATSVFLGDGQEPLAVNLEVTPPQGFDLMDWNTWTIEVNVADGIDPMELTSTGFCYDTYPRDIVVTRTFNPTADQMPEGVEPADILITSTIDGDSVTDHTPCMWLMATVEDIK